MSLSRSPSPPTATHLSARLPTPALVLSIAGAAHYSGVSRPIRGERIGASFGRGVSLEDLSDGRKRILNDLKELFCSRPTVELLERTWRPDAVFEDPLSICVGYKEYAPQWFAMPKLFPQSETIASHVLSSTYNPNRLIYSQTQQYTLRFFGTKKVVESLVIVDLDDEEKIIKLEDKWNGEDQPTRWGASFLRRLNARTLPWFIRVSDPKEKTH